MKNLFLIFVFSLFIISCKKENNEVKFLTFIKAGQTDGIGIKYVDFEPDKFFAGDQPAYDSTKLYLDLNKDSIYDFKLIYYYSSRRSCCYGLDAVIIPLGQNSVCVSKDAPYVESLEPGDTIGLNNNWSNSKLYLYQFWHSQYPTPNGEYLIQESFEGSWYDHDDIYAGVKIIKDDIEFFGWIDVKMKGQAVRGYAVTKPY